ncbi:uncharacterized protein [Blastocystis hominis]|uniref:Uncharacterized protein n=1 Tax=Blastocystis hominis TaxID=12968 RepID=D8LVW1_BLAHO|nr:uncharacterized protein [Blastocystis hominis]CBK19950.2 unnamed protein product [Blastocystis hominis]|eukprot:XP_012893998.1 uncharacterized protein [Blastocystis hominis]
MLDTMSLFLLWMFRERLFGEPSSWTVLPPAFTRKPSLTIWTCARPFLISLFNKLSLAIM